MEYINTTPHDVTIIAPDGTTVLSVPPSGDCVRLSESVAPIGSTDGVDFVSVTLGDADGLPAPRTGVAVIVSMPLAMGLLASGVRREDVVYPFGQVRDGRGGIIGCRQLARLSA